MDVTFVRWPHEYDAPTDFLKHLNTSHLRIHFTMKREANFEPTNLHKNSNYHPAQKRKILKSLAHLAKRNCETEYLLEEPKHLKEGYKVNEYLRAEI